MSTFSPSFQVAYLIFASVVFLVVAWATGARRRRVLGALAAVATFTALSAPIDELGARRGWWTYPSCVDPAHPPLLVYVGQALVFVGGVAFLGWRVQRRWGVFGVLRFVVIVCLLGLVRDSVGAAIFPEVLRFGPAPAAQLADVAAWAVVVVVGLVVPRVVAGPAHADAPR